MERSSWMGWGMLTLGAVAACSSGSSDEESACDALADCCASLSGAEAEQCQAAVASSGATDSACSSALATLQDAGLCGSAGSGGSTTDDDGGTPGMTGCAALASCCPELPAQQDPTECMTVASSGTTLACTESLDGYQMAGFCTDAEPNLPFHPNEGGGLSCGAEGGSGQIVVAVSDGTTALCSATVIASQLGATWALALSDTGSCSYVGGSGSTGSSVRIQATAPGFSTDSTTVPGGGCESVTLGLAPE
jgi:hypothetical protein